MAKILCIEDETDLRENIVEELNDAGYETIEAANGQEGLDAILACKPDLVLCDIRMPVMDGHQLLKHVRENLPDLADTPFIFLTALDSRDNVVSGKILGADDYLTKPIDFDLLLATVKARFEQLGRIRAKKEAEFVRLYKHLSKPAGDDHKQPAPCGGSPQQTHEFNNKVAEAAALNGNKVTSGRMQMIGLRDLKRSLGDRWKELAEKVLPLAEETIGSLLQPDDALISTDDEAFIICFASLSEEDGWARANEIERQIVERILASGNVRTCADSVAPGMGVDRLTRIDTEVREIAIAPSELVGTKSPTALIGSRLDAIAVEIRSNAIALLSEITGNCRFRPRKLQTRRGAPANLQIADFDAFTRTSIAKVRKQCHGDIEVTANLDVLIVGSAAEHLYRESHGKMPSIIADISFSTINDTWYAGQLVDTCSKVSGILSQHLMFRICEFPTSGAGNLLSEALTLLQEHSKAQMIQVSEPTLGTIDLTTHKLPVVAMDYPDFSRHAKRDKGSVQAFFDKVHDCNARILIDNVSKFDKPALIDDWNVDFIGLEPDD